MNQDIDTKQNSWMLDIEKMECVVPKPKRDLKYIVLEIIQNLCSESPEKTAHIDAILNVTSKSYGMENKFVEEIIEKLCHRGELIEPIRCRYKVLG